MKLHVLHPVLFFAIGILVGCSHEIELVDFATEASYDLQESQIAVLFQAQADTASVTVHSNGKWSIEATNDRASSWLTYSPEGGGKGDTRVKIEVTANDEYEERSAVLHFRNGKEERTINVVQKPEKAFLVSSEKAEFGPSGGSFDVMVTSNISYTLTIVDAPWLHQVITRGVEETLSFTVDRNDRADKRQGKLVFVSELGTETVTVYQTGVSPQMILSANGVDVPSEGGRVRVDVSSNFNVEYSISADWICEITTRSLSTNSYSFYVERNPDFDGRSAEIVFRNAEKSISETVTIHQSQQDAIVLGQGTYEIDYKEQTFSMTVSANVDVQVELPEGIDWLTPVRTKGLSDRTLTFSVTENTTKEPREAYIILTSGDLRQSVRLSQLPTTHFPTTHEEWEQSVAITEQSSNVIGRLIEEYQDNHQDITSFLEKVMMVEGIIQAKTNEDASVMMVMQKDSIWINYQIKEDLNYSVPLLNSANNARLLDNPMQSISKSQNKAADGGESEDDTNGEYYVSRTRKALVLAPFQDEFHSPLDNWEELLYTRFDKVDVLPNEKANILCFTEGFLAQYDFILINTHGGDGYFEVTPLGKIHGLTYKVTTSTRYSLSVIEKLYTEYGFSPDQLCVFWHDWKTYMCMTPQFLNKKRLDNCVVILSACNSAYKMNNFTEDDANGSLLGAFLNNGARLVSGTATDMASGAQDVFDEMMIRYMLYGLSFQEAFKYIINTEKSETVARQYYNYFPETDYSGWDIPHNYRYKARLDTNNEPFYLFDPYPKNLKQDIGDKKVSFSWDCELASFTIPWHDNIVKSAVDHWEDVEYQYVVRYDVYVDDSRLGKSFGTDDTDKKASWTISSYDKHSWYVVAKIMEGDTVIASYQSEEASFTVTNNVAVERVSLNKTELELKIGNSATLTATVLPENATNKNVSWSSSNVAVATVSSTGEVRGVGKGNAVITVTTEDGGKKASCNVTVKETTVGGDIEGTEEDPWN